MANKKAPPIASKWQGTQILRNESRLRRDVPAVRLPYSEVTKNAGQPKAKNCS